MTKRAKSTPQLVALKCLKLVIFQGQSLNTILASGLEGLPEKQHGLVKDFLFGCCRYFFGLHQLYLQLIDKPLKTKEQDTYCLLIVGLYQILFSHSTHARAVNEIVETAHLIQRKWSKGLINAMLRKACQNRKVYSDQVKEHPNLPEWLIQEIEKSYTQLQLEQIIYAYKTQAPMTLRASPQALAQPEKIEALDATPGKLAPSAYYLTQAQPVHMIPGFLDGLVSVQDEAAQLAAYLVQPLPGERILDLCAAPGGKTAHLLQLEPQIQLTAIDSDPHRAVRIQENLSRIQGQAQIIHAQGQHLTQWWDGTPFDKVLLDAPCSATGVIRRHPDIKLLRQQSDLEKLAALQLELLNQAWKTLKQGGRLVYATCSILSCENDEVITQFLKDHQDAKLDPITWQDQNYSGSLQLLPSENSYDGFYYACLVKNK